MTVQMDTVAVVRRALENYNNQELAPYVRAQSLITAYFIDYMHPEELRIKDPLFSLQEEMQEGFAAGFMAFVENQAEAGAGDLSVEVFVNTTIATLSRPIPLTPFAGVHPELSRLITYMVYANAIAFTAAVIADEDLVEKFTNNILLKSSLDKLISDLMAEQGEVIFALAPEPEEQHELLMEYPLIAGYTTKNRKAAYLLAPPEGELRHLFDLAMEAFQQKKAKATLERGEKADLANRAIRSAETMYLSIGETAGALEEGVHPQFEDMSPSVGHIYTLRLSQEVQDGGQEVEDQELETIDQAPTSQGDIILEEKPDTKVAKIALDEAQDPYLRAMAYITLSYRYRETDPDNPLRYIPLVIDGLAFNVLRAFYAFKQIALAEEVYPTVDEFDKWLHAVPGAELNRIWSDKKTYKELLQNDHRDSANVACIMHLSWHYAMCLTRAMVPLTRGILGQLEQMMVAKQPMDGNKITQQYTTPLTASLHGKLHPQYPVIVGVGRKSTLKSAVMMTCDASVSRPFHDIWNSTADDLEKGTHPEYLNERVLFESYTFGECKTNAPTRKPKPSISVGLPGEVEFKSEYFERIRKGMDQQDIASQVNCRMLLAVFSEDPTPDERKLLYIPSACLGMHLCMGGDIKQNVSDMCVSGDFIPQEWASIAIPMLTQFAEGGLGLPLVDEDLKVAVDKAKDNPLEMVKVISLLYNDGYWKKIYQPVAIKSEGGMSFGLKGVQLTAR